MKTTQTTKLNGKRVRLTTTIKGGKTSVTVADAPVLEWELQAEQCRRLKAMPEYGRQFLLLGGMEAGRRGRQEQMKAKATGLTAGHPDLTIFLPGGRVAMIENKAELGRLAPDQKNRHAALAAIGHTVEVVKAATAKEAAEKAVALVRGWLGQQEELAA